MDPYESQSSYYTDPISVPSSGVNWIFPTILILFLVALGVTVFSALKKRKSAQIERMLKRTAFQITLPKQQSLDEDKRDSKEAIGAMETLYASLQHFYQDGFWQNLWYGQPTFSFEMTAHHGNICFYVVFPREYSDQMERQIHSQYPTAHIEVVKDYDIFLEEGGESAVSGVTLLKNHIFPVKSYKYLEYDPLSALTNSLSKVGRGKAAIQVLVQPTNQGWQKGVEDALHSIQQGKSFNSKNKGVASKVFSIAKEVGETAFTDKTQNEQTNEAGNTTSGNVRLTAMQEAQAKLMVEKASKVGLKVQIRVVARAESHIEAKNQVQTMLSSFAQFQAPESNCFKKVAKDVRLLLTHYILRTFTPKQPTMILTTEELTSILHFPNRHLDTPGMLWLSARKLPPPVKLPKSGLRLGYSGFRGTEIPVFLGDEDRLRHFYMIGKTGVGKTAIFENMVLQDIRAGKGICYMDPNGDAVEWILNHIPKERAEDVILFDPSDTARPMALNLLEYDPQYPEQKSMIINEVLSIFDKLYDLKATGGPMFEQYMRNAMLLIMDDPESGSTLMEIPKVLANEEFRKYKLSKSNNQIVKDFWVKEAEAAGGEAALANIVPYITSKLTQFTSNDIMRPIIGQQHSAFNFRKAMDENKIILVTLPKGLLGDINSQLLGMIISGKIQIAAFSRQNVKEEERVPFYMYVDEFQNFTSKTFATILSEARKYKLSLNITHQYIEQLDEETRGAVMGNAGTMLAWRIGAADAEFFQKEFDPLRIDDMVNTEKFNFYIKLLIDGTPTAPFNATSYAPDPHENFQVGEATRQLSRLKYGRDRELVESEIRLRGRMTAK